MFTVMQTTVSGYELSVRGEVSADPRNTLMPTGITIGLTPLRHPVGAQPFDPLGKPLPC